eukprot:gnl/MRDRNA2_/MRDRNA2_155783_c0_seq1.p1 gnl/MRDRNA2_/MRDRNA2_155783_c0~~gnl/MRDRNA2_/MRDRNA2_155783_c0_seq1.p1  ORF type:complete len:326 (-),score=34.65 gnl/MRDRNA2_/MRDRNA2_155783_c0_seq1:77-1054(-)
MSEFAAGLWRLVPERLQTTVLCSAYVVSGPLLIVLNSRILNHYKYPYPAIVSSVGLLASTIIIHVASYVGKIKIQQEISRDFFLKSIFPIGCLSSATIVLGNIVYLHLSVAFIQMLKALTPVYILLTMFIFRLDKPSTELISSVTVISLGTGMASVGELHFSVLGFILQSFADVTEGLKLVLQDVLLKHLKLSPVESLYFVAPASLACQGLYILVMEHEGFKLNTGGKLIAEHGSVVLFVAVVGFFVNILGFLVMQRTNGLFLKLLSILRSNGLVVVSYFLIPGNDVTFVQWCGYSLSMVGFIWYVILKQRPPPKKLGAIRPMAI